MKKPTIQCVVEYRKEYVGVRVAKLYPEYHLKLLLLYLYMPIASLYFSI